MSILTMKEKEMNSSKTHLIDCNKSNIMERLYVSWKNSWTLMF